MQGSKRNRCFFSRTRLPLVKLSELPMMMTMTGEPIEELGVVVVVDE